MCVDLDRQLVLVAHLGVAHHSLGHVNANDLYIVPVSSDVLFPAYYLARLSVVVGYEMAVTLGKLEVETVEIVVHHALGGEARSDLSNGVLDSLHPLR